MAQCIQIKKTARREVSGGVRFAIVGAGPKGTYALERLVASLRSYPGRSPIQIDVFETSGMFGSGRIYSPCQPEYLLMNYSASNIDMWPVEDREGSGVSDAQNLTDWMRSHGYPEARGNEFVPRSLVGKYLADGFWKIVSAAKPSIEIRPIEGTAVAIARGENDLIDLRVETAGRSILERSYDRVMLTTGHQFREPDERPPKFTNEIASVFPVSSLREVEPRQNVAVRGMGLTFIDCAIALTEGRGGKFITDSSGRMSYRRSGDEPNQIYPYSRSGKLMTPRGPSPVEQKLEDPLADLVEGRSCRQRSPIDFEETIWPLLERSFDRIPMGGSHPEPMRDHHLRTVTSLRRDLSDITPSAARQKRARVWPSAIETFRKLYEFGGLDSESHRAFDSRWAGQLARISFGPPPENARKILALADAGLLNFTFSENPELTRQGSQIRIGRRDRSGTETAADIHINATIPGNRKQKDLLSPLFRDLVGSGLGRYFKRDGYTPGCLEIDRRGQLVSEKCHAVPIHLYGTPTEGIVFDNDTLSRTANDFTRPWAEACLKTLQRKCPF